jgi:ketosteroid isomerase-like protein
LKFINSSLKIKKMNLSKKAADVHSILANAYNTGNVDIVLSMYDVTGILVGEPGGQPLSGKEKFEEAVKGILSIKGKMEIKTVYCLQVGDLAVGRSEWNITDDGEVKISAKGIEVMKQQADGTWKIIVDHAFGAEASLVA